MLVWSIGINLPEGPSTLVETVTRATFQGRPTWRVTHYDHDPAAATDGGGFVDLYDVDAKTFAPIRSFMRTDGQTLELLFEREAVTLRRVSATERTEEHFPLTVTVKPEGPGATAFVAGLPLRPGYQLSYHLVDRWNGKGATRVKLVTLRVVGESRMTLPSGPEEVFEIIISPGDESFEIRERVRKSFPHYKLSVDYIRGDLTLLSEVTSLAIGQ